MNDWHAEADRLRADGLSIREIAERVGMARGTVGEHFKPSLCACGGRRAHRHVQCWECRLAELAASRAAAEAILIRMWREGAARRDIAAAIGYTPNVVGTRVCKLRAAGVELPYRRPDAIELGRSISRFKAAA